MVASGYEISLVFNSTSLVSYQVKYSKRNSISTCGHVLFSVSQSCATTVYFFGASWRRIQCVLNYSILDHEFFFISRTSFEV